MLHFVPQFNTNQKGQFLLNLAHQLFNGFVFIESSNYFKLVSIVRLGLVNYHQQIWWTRIHLCHCYSNFLTLRSARYYLLVCIFKKHLFLELMFDFYRILFGATTTILHRILLKSVNLKCSNAFRPQL